jgi:SAM-dependent methyltransferase
MGRSLMPIVRKWGSYRYEDVLDWGCGSSPFRQFFVRTRNYIRVDKIAIDGEIIVAVDERIPLPDQSADVILVSQALGDVPDLDLFFREMRRVLRTRGKVFVIETMCYPEHDLPDDYYRVMPNGLQWHARNNGFRCVEIQRLGGLFCRLAQLVNTFVLGWLKRVAVLRIIAEAGVCLVNTACWIADRACPRPTLAPDYAATLEKVV